MLSETGVEGDVSTFLPQFDPFSPVSSGSKEDVRLKVRIARLQMEAQEKAEKRQAELDLRLKIRTLEIESEKQVKMRQMELDAMKIVGGMTAQSVQVMPVPSPVIPGPSRVPTASPPGDINSVTGTFDVGKYITLVPNFRETEVDSYFNAFERIATSLCWPKEVWTILLQCKLVGKAQEVFSTLPLEESLKYDTVKLAILRAYELVPEAYRQRFRNHKKHSSSTFVEFAREKSALLDKWCNTSKVDDFVSLRELILLEDFKGCLPERVVVYLNEQKVSSLSHAAVLADEFVLTHKTVFSSRMDKSTVRPSTSDQSSRLKTVPSSKDVRECFYCHKQGHLIADCNALKRKQTQQPKSVGLLNATRQEERFIFEGKEDTPDVGYEPFVMKGLISLSDDGTEQKEVQILRDTGANQSFVLADVLSLSSDSYCGSSVFVRGIEMGVVKVPLHRVYMKSALVTGYVKVGVRPSLPVKGVTFILGNDLAGGKVMPMLEVTDMPKMGLASDELSRVYPDVFSACVVTRAQSREMVDEVDLTDTFMVQNLGHEGRTKTNSELVQKHESNLKCSEKALSSVDLRLPVTRDKIIAAQNQDQTLRKCFSNVVNSDVVENRNTAFFLESGMLMRKWCSVVDADVDWSAVYQIVVPSEYRQYVLSLAHEHALSGHLGVTKTYNRILRHFFWPGLKRDVVRFCRICHICQLTGKPNQLIPPAPLSPIPVVGEAFEQVLVDCVGPLPKTKSGNQFLCTIMCRVTRFPEAVPLRKITAPAIVKTLLQFFSTFGLPKVIQTDQGTNFLSRLFAQVLKSLSIEHRVSSAYHPESQGAIERFHQTLKSMLRKYCMETGNSWDEGVPLVLFAIRETVQESLGFSPAQLVFGHTVRGPLKVLKEKMLEVDSNSEMHILDYVSRFRERLHFACSFAQKSLVTAQSKMKNRYDVKAVSRSFQPGDEVLVLLPIQGSALSARFSGPYVVLKKISETDYVIRTPDRKRQSRVCHINMLKAYHTRDNTRNRSTEMTIGPMESPVALTCEVQSNLEDEVGADDDIILRNTFHQCAKLENSEILKNLQTHLSHLPEDQSRDIVGVITDFSSLFGDVPSQTTVLRHDINVGGAFPIKQHAYRVNAVKRTIMKQETEYLLKNGLAKHSSSPWSSPCLLVHKPDGSFRFCTDYRRINAVTVPDCYPLPRMEDCIDNLGSAKFVSKLDLLKGYWQVPLTSRASDISAFVTPDCFMQYHVMAFGLRNAPATFQRLIQTVLAGVPNCNAYLDDLVLYSTEWMEHLKLLRTVFERLEKASLTLNLSKCVFGKASVTYLGKEVGEGQVKPVEAKVAAIVDFPVPTSRRELRRFLGMAGYYRSFCKNFSTVVTPLTSLLSPANSFIWTEDCQNAFEEVKAMLYSAPILAAPNFERCFKLEVDASAVGAGAVLLQQDDLGVDHPVCYYSKKFIKHQRNYSVIEKETLALLLALQFFEVYLGSSNVPIVVYTDHNPLVFLSKMYNKNQRLMRWSLVVQGY
uniref:Gypsy retrotransposon integrase-like protein 1 n=1 Tax=Cyprinus carpio TaxID=7962 RepID=A0A8C1TD20_CYPCA